MDDGKIVAGMTSSRKLEHSNLPSNTNKGNVRIWAGEAPNADLTKAPFTVTDEGVLSCNSSSGNSIVIKDGTIYFTVGGDTYRLGITNGKPDWVTTANLSNVYYY